MRHQHTACRLPKMGMCVWLRLRRFVWGIRGLMSLCTAGIFL